MNVIEIINKKRLGNVLSSDEVAYMVNGYVDGSIKDYQMSSFLMSICINGMNIEEVSALTDVMIKSGERLDFSYLGDNVVDKHSTGGVGDKTTLVLSPIVAACGVNVAKMSGRGLGFTGGTIDKLESIKGFKTSLTNEEFTKQVKDIHLAVVSGGKDLVIADKKIYALRDVTGTVESIPLIASSIMSKKIAAGTKKIVIDVKVGKGALMKTIEDARVLANTMIEIGRNHGVLVRCVLTRMDEPLGFAIGNGLEVKEAIDSLNGKFSNDFYELILVLATHMVSMGLDIDISLAKEKVLNVIENNLGYDYFKRMVEYQGGDISNISISLNKLDIKSKSSGYIHNIDAYRLANVSLSLGSGRCELTDKIDHSVGIWLNKKTGDYVNQGDSLATIYYNKKDVLIDEVISSFDIKEEVKEKDSIVLEVIS